VDGIAANIGRALMRLCQQCAASAHPTGVAVAGVLCLSTGSVHRFAHPRPPRSRHLDAEGAPNCWNSHALTSHRLVLLRRSDLTPRAFGLFRSPKSKRTPPRCWLDRLAVTANNEEIPLDACRSKALGPKTPAPVRRRRGILPALRSLPNRRRPEHKGLGSARWHSRTISRTAIMACGAWRLRQALPATAQSVAVAWHAARTMAAKLSFPESLTALSCRGQSRRGRFRAPPHHARARGFRPRTPRCRARG
jgi:hypothetical protein